MDDIDRGYTTVVTVDCLRKLKLKHCEVYPYGLQHQTSVDHLGNTIPKKRLTHNLSAKKKSRLSINQRVDLDQLTDTQYGFALLSKAHTHNSCNPFQQPKRTHLMQQSRHRQSFP
eukprot:scaffold2523_cov193-Skeletonema_menzelii.AAC.6